MGGASHPMQPLDEMLHKHRIQTVRMLIPRHRASMFAFSRSMALRGAQFIVFIVPQMAYALKGGWCTATLRIIPSPLKSSKMPHLNTCWRGQRHGVASSFLSARPARTPLAFCHRAPFPAQAFSDGSGRASSA
jgi:hypothetical protein